MDEKTNEEQKPLADQAVLSDSSMACKNKTERFNLLCKILNKHAKAYNLAIEIALLRIQT